MATMTVAPAHRYGRRVWRIVGGSDLSDAGAQTRALWALTARATASPAMIDNLAVLGIPTICEHCGATLTGRTLDVHAV